MSEIRDCFALLHFLVGTVESWSDREWLALFKLMMRTNKSCCFFYTYADKFFGISPPFADNGASWYIEERGRTFGGYCFGQQSLAGAWRSKQKQTAPGCQHTLKQSRVLGGVHHRLLQQPLWFFQTLHIAPVDVQGVQKYFLSQKIPKLVRGNKNTRYKYIIFLRYTLEILCY